MKKQIKIYQLLSVTQQNMSHSPDKTDIRNPVHTINHPMFMQYRMFHNIPLRSLKCFKKAVNKQMVI